MKLLAHFVPSGEGETTSILNQLQPQRWLPCAPFVKRIAFRGSICSLMDNGIQTPHRAFRRRQPHP